MPPVVLKLFAGQGTGQTDKAATICPPPPFEEHKKQLLLLAHADSQFTSTVKTEQPEVVPLYIS